MSEATTYKLPKFFTVIFFAIAGFVITFLFLNNNYIDYPDLKNQVSFCNRDSSNCVTFNLKRTFLKPDTTAFADTKKVTNGGIKVLFHYNPSFLIWTMLILLLMTVSMGALPVFVDFIRSIKKKFSVNKKSLFRIIAFAVVCAAIMVVLPLSLKGYYTPYRIIKDLHILLKHGIVIISLSIASIILSLPMIITMFMVGTAADKVKIREATSAREAVDNFNYLNSVLLSALQVLAIIVVLSGFCSAALGESIKSTFTISGLDIFPKEMSYVYGLFYAMFLAIFYLPVYFVLKEKGKALHNEIILSSEGLDEQAAKEQKEIGENVELKTSALDSLKLALTILSPLIASFIPEHLQIFK